MLPGVEITRQGPAARERSAARTQFGALLIGLLIGAAMLGSMPAQAQAPAPVTMEVTIGLDGFVDPDRATVVVVDLAAEVLVVGDLVVTIGRRDLTTPVELPAGSVKRFVVEGPPLGTSRQVTVELQRTVDGSTESLARETLRPRVASGELPVAVWGAPGAVTAIRSASTTPIGRDVIGVEVDAGRLEAALSGAQYLVVGEGAELDDDRQAVIERWVRAGGRMVAPSRVTARFAAPGAGEPLDGVAVTVARLDRGEVGTAETLESLGEQDWSRYLRDVPPPGLIRDFSAEEQAAGLISTATVGQEATVPGFSWLLLGIIAFVLLVGPLNFVALRAIGKPELAWVTVPMLSVLFAGVFWLVGRGQVVDVSVNHAAVVVDGPVRTATAGVVVQIEDGGEHRVELFDGAGVFPPAFSGIAAPQEVSGSAARFTLDDLGVGGLEAQWEPDDVPVTVDIRVTDGRIVATASNDSGWDFDTWGIVVAGRAAAAGDPLPAGGEGEMDTAVTRFGGASYDAVIAQAVGFSFRREGSINRQQVVTALGRYAERLDRDIRRDEAYFFGFTDDISLPVVVDGRVLAATGPTLVVKRVELDADDRYGLGKLRPDLLDVAGASSVEGYYDDIYAYGAESITFRYLLPDGLAERLDRVEIRPTTTSLDTASAWHWGRGEFVPIEWKQPFSLDGLVSAGGELIVRGEAGDRQFFEESLQPERFALRWEVP